MELIKNKINLPEETSDGVPTLNKMGYMAMTLDYYSRKFVAHASICNQQVLEIGAAFGYASFEALRGGATILSNDIDSNHIKIIEENCPKEYKNRMTTKVGNFMEIDLPENHFDAILIARVLHFMDGDTLRKALMRCYQLLRKNGKLFIVADSPYIKDAKLFIPTFESNLKNKKTWPGLVEDIASIHSSSVSSLPKMFHFLDPITLRRELERLNFYIEDISFFERDDYSKDQRLDGREGIGAIAVKMELKN